MKHRKHQISKCEKQNKILFLKNIKIDEEKTNIKYKKI